MSIAFWCVVVVMFLPYIPTVIAARHKKAQFGAFDNDLPRVQGAQLTGAGARAWGAHNNALEARAPFAAAVIIAHIQGVAVETAGALALAFVACRVLHMFAYLGGRASLRSILFGLSMAAVLALFILAALA